MLYLHTENKIVILQSMNTQSLTNTKQYFKKLLVDLFFRLVTMAFSMNEQRTTWSILCKILEVF